MAVIDVLNEIFIQVFDDDEIKILPEMTANDVEGWDSLSHVLLITTIENKFQIRFAQKELLTFKCVADLIRAIESKITQ